MDEHGLWKAASAAPYGRILETIGNRPLAYVTTGLPFWDDGHIARQMLEAHLDPDVEAASRTHGFMDRSAAWMISLLDGRAGNILDLGCGPGLYAQRFADQGYRVTGLDISNHSITYAKTHFGDEERVFIHQDYLTMDYEEVYDLAILVYCDFGVLSPENQRVLLKKAYRGLKEGGLFLVDVFTPQYFKDFTDSLTVEYEDGGFWRACPYLNIMRNASYPNQTYLEQFTIITAQDCSTYNIWNKGFEPEELKEHLLDAGFDSVALYGDAAGAELTEESSVVCAVCRK